MPTYTINGKRIKTDTQLTDEQIDEIAADLAKESASAPTEAPEAPAEAPEAAPAKAPEAAPAKAPVAAPEEAPGAGRSFLEQLGRQIGLTARAGVTGALGIPVAAGDLFMRGASALTGQELPTTTQSLNTLLNRLYVPQPETAQERAVQAGAGAVADVMATGGSKTLAKYLPEALTANLGRQGMAAAGAGTGAQVAAEAAQEEGWGEGATLGVALLGGLIGGTTTAGVGGMGRAAGSSAKAREASNWFANTKLGKSMGATVQDKPLTVDQIRQVGSTAYKRVDDSGITLRPIAAENVIKNAESNLKGFIPDMDAHRPVAAVFKHIKDAIAKKGAAGVSFAELDKLRSDMSALSGNAGDTATREMARKAVVALDEQIAGLTSKNLRPPASGVAPGVALSKAMEDLKEARTAWRRASKVEGLDHVMDIAKLNAESSAGKLSLGESLKREFLKLAKNDNALRGYSTAEKAQIRQLATGSGIEDLALQLARLDPRKSGFGAVMTIGATATAPHIGIPLAASTVLAEGGVAAAKTRALNRLRQDILAGTVSKPANNAQMRMMLESYIAAEREMNQ